MSALIQTRVCPIHFQRPVSRKHRKPLLQNWPAGLKMAGSIWLAVVAEPHPNTFARSPTPCVAARRALFLQMELNKSLQLSGLEPLNITPEFGFAVIGERTNI